MLKFSNNQFCRKCINRFFCNKRDVDKLTDENGVKKVTKSQKTRGNFLRPAMESNKLENFESIVGLHLAPNGISWAKLTRADNRLIEWDAAELTQLPRKSLPIEIYPFAKSMLEKIPEGSFYIMETPESPSPMNQKPTTLFINTQQLIFSSILITLLYNRNDDHNYLSDNNSNIYYLKSKLPARLFGLLIGTETVSNASKISKLVENNEENLKYTPVVIDNEFQNKFFTSARVHKELLGYSLMIAVCFMDLCVYKNSKSISAVTKSKKQL